MERSARLVIDDLACRRAERTLFDGLSLTVVSGAALHVAGPNAAGKTSLLRILAGLLAAKQGKVGLAGLSGEDIPDTERMTFVGARSGVRPPLTVDEHLAFWLAMACEGRAALADIRLAWRLERLGGTPAGWLSSGQRRRLELARLSCERRQVWLLDEPLNALDDDSALLLAERVASHRAAGGLVVAASHQPLNWPDLARLDLAPLGTRAA
jgi:heme exporter protein A